MRKSYQQLLVWQLAMDLAEAGYDVARTLPKEERFEMASQLRKAAVSVPSNIAEGHGRLTARDFARHLSIASGSVKEIEVVVLLARRIYLVPQPLAERALRMASEVGRMLAGLIATINRQQAGKMA